MTILSLVLAAQVASGAFLGIRPGVTSEELVYRNAGMDTVVKLPVLSRSDDRISYIQPSRDGKHVAIYRGQDIIIYRLNDHTSLMWRPEASPLGMHWDDRGGLIYALEGMSSSPTDPAAARTSVWTLYRWEPNMASAKTMGSPVRDMAMARKLMWKSEFPTADALPPDMRSVTDVANLNRHGFYPYSDAVMLFPALKKSGIYGVKGRDISIYDWTTNSTKLVSLPRAARFVRPVGENLISVTLIENPSSERTSDGRLGFERLGFVIPGSAEKYRTAIINVRNGNVTMVDGLAGAVPAPVSF